MICVTHLPAAYYNVGRPAKKGAVHRLAILSRFLGHTQIRDTYWYFSAFPQLLTEALGHFESPDHDYS
jgi:hypothetical protein